MSDILKFGITFVKKNKRYPSLVDMASVGITRAMLRTEFDNLEGFKTQLAKHCTEYICDLSRHKHKESPKPSVKTFIITTVVAGAPLDTGFYKNIKAYCKDFNAQLLVLVSMPKSDNSLIVPKELSSEVFILEDTKLNDNVFILGLKNAANSVDPITGLPRIGQRNGTFICASPKQRLKFVPTGINVFPHAIMSTGAITNPNYMKSKVLVDKSSYMADNDHVMGAVVLELDKDNTFHFRQIQAAKDGSFVDLGAYYVNGRKQTLAPEAIVVGDWHAGDTDPKVEAALKELTKRVRPKRWVMHDIFDGLSINPHTLGKSIVRSKLALAGKMNLTLELEKLKTDINMMAKLVPEVVIVRSNHDDFLDRYLDTAGYVDDHTNHRLALDLAAHLLDGRNPLEEYIGKVKNVTWLKLDQSYSIAGVECGMHGHLGSNGSRGSITQMETAYGSVMFGHSHTPGILRNAWNVGTSTYLELGYNKGASSWVQCSGLVYPNGQKQLINFINGRYTNRK